MIVRPIPHPDHPDDWLLVKQCDHDDHAGYMLTHLTGEEYWQPTDHRLLTMAAYSHDIGSAPYEDYARIDGDGKPWQFWNIPPDDHLDWHRGGVEVGCGIDPYVGLLVSLHVVGIHRDRLGINDNDPAPVAHIPIDHTPQVDAFVAEQTALQARLLAEVERRRGQPFPREHLMNDFRLLELFDSISVRLTAFAAQARDYTFVADRDGNIMTVQLRPVSRWEFRLTPFPFAGERFECPSVGRALPRKAYRDNDEFQAAWVAAKLVWLPYVCVR